MPLSFSAPAIIEKNKLNASGAWLTLVEIAYPGETPLRLVQNNEDVTWNGNPYQIAYFELDAITQSKEGELPTLTLSFPDPGRKLTTLLDDYDGGVGADVTISIIHSDHLDLVTPEIEEEFEIIDVAIDFNNIIKIKLGLDNLMQYRIPQNRYLKDHCRYKTFKGSECLYDGVEVSCNRTFAQCKGYGNQNRFGGFPGVGSRGYFE